MVNVDERISGEFRELLESTIVAAELMGHEVMNAHSSDCNFRIVTDNLVIYLDYAFKQGRVKYVTMNIYVGRDKYMNHYTCINGHRKMFGMINELL